MAATWIITPDDLKSRGSSVPTPVHAEGSAVPMESQGFDDDATREAWADVPTAGWSSGALSVQLEGYPATATTGTVSIGVTPVIFADGDNMETKTVTESEVIVTMTATGDKERVTESGSVSAPTGMATTAKLKLRIRRIPSDGSDNLSGRWSFTEAQVAYT